MNQLLTGVIDIMAKSTEVKVVAKMAQARAIFTRNLKSIQAGAPGTRARVLGLFVEKCNLTTGAASTYYQSIRKENIAAGSLVLAEAA